MKFFCEYCGNRIDAEKEHKCSNCGASYKKNKEFIRLQEEKKKNLEMNNEYKYKVINHVIGTMKFSKVFMIIPIIMFIVVFTIIIIGFININKEPSINDIFETNKENNKNQEIIVGYNEYAETSKYRVKVEKYETVRDIFHKAEDGYELVKFHLIVENITDSEIRKEDVNCIVDGIAQNNDFSSGYSDLPMFISRKLAVKGTSTFIVPINASSYDIRYGDYITIHIEK